jgi:hypothetical protein
MRETGRTDVGDFPPHGSDFARQISAKLRAEVPLPILIIDASHTRTAGERRGLAVKSPATAAQARVAIPSILGKSRHGVVRHRAKGAKVCPQHSVGS